MFRLITHSTATLHQNDRSQHIEQSSAATGARKPITGVYISGS